MNYLVFAILCISISLYPMQNQVQPNGVPINHFMNRLELALRRGNDADVKKMYEESRERRPQIRARVHMEQKPALLTSFDALDTEENSRNEGRDAFDVLQEQNTKNFDDEYERVQKSAQEGDFKPATELMEQYRICGHLGCCNAIKMLIAYEKSVQQKNIQFLLDIKKEREEARYENEAERKKELDVIETIINGIRATIGSAPDQNMMGNEENVRQPDAQYEDILLPAANGTPAPVRRPQRQTQASFLALSVEGRNKVIYGLVQERNLEKLFALKAEAPNCKEIDNAIQKVVTMEDSLQQPRTVQPRAQHRPNNSESSVLNNVVQTLAENPVDAAMAAAGIIAGIITLSGKNRS